MAYYSVHSPRLLAKCKHNLSIHPAPSISLLLQHSSSWLDSWHNFDKIRKSCEVGFSHSITDRDVKESSPCPVLSLLCNLDNAVEQQIGELVLQWNLYFFFLINFSWSIALQGCVSFLCTAKWISCMFVCVCVCVYMCVYIYISLLFWISFLFRSTEDWLLEFPISVKVAVMSDSLWPHGLYSPWNSPGQNTGVGSPPFSKGSSQPRNWTGVSCIAGGFFTNWAFREASRVNYAIQ